MTPFGEEWLIVKDKIQEDFIRTRKDNSWIEAHLDLITFKEKQLDYKELSMAEAQEYLDECFCAYAELMVLRLAYTNKTPVTE